MEEVEKVGKLGEGEEAEEDGSVVVDNHHASKLLGELKQYIKNRNVSVNHKFTDHGNTTAYVIVLTDNIKDKIVGSITIYNITVIDEDEDGDKKSNGRPGKGYMSVGWLNTNSDYQGLGWATILLLYAILYVYLFWYFIKVMLDDDSDNYADPANNIYNKVGFESVTGDGPEKVMYLSNEILIEFQNKIDKYKKNNPIVPKRHHKQHAIAATQKFINEQINIINRSFEKVEEEYEQPPLKRSKTFNPRRSARIIKNKEINKAISIARANSRIEFNKIQGIEGGKKNKSKRKRKSKKRKTKKRKSRKII